SHIVISVFNPAFNLSALREPHYSHMRTTAIQHYCVSLVYTDSPQDTEAEIKSHDVREGQSVTLSCSAKGQPPPTFTWYRYSQGKNPAPQHSGAVWEINSAQIQDSGEYVCLAQNKHGAQRSQYVKIDVQFSDGPSVEVRVSPPPPYTQGQRLSLSCDVLQSNPPPFSFTWYKNNQRLSSVQTYSKTLQPEDRGSYSCSAQKHFVPHSHSKHTLIHPGHYTSF
uniref:Ig-like domain-containing protein n=1 Tax=Neogobius melanostomus TaxID=47308 RepID=A0A8C6SPN2_9GOBI